jgi:hypothetical protein
MFVASHKSQNTDFITTCHSVPMCGEIQLLLTIKHSKVKVQHAGYVQAWYFHAKEGSACGFLWCCCQEDHNLST